MSILLLVVGAAVVWTAGFVLGLRYAKRRLPLILATMPIEELGRIGTEASKLRNYPPDPEVPPEGDGPGHPG